MQDKNKNELKITVDVQPQDSYVQARNALYKALQAFDKLTPAQRQQLAIEVFGVEMMSRFIDMTQNYRRNR